MRIEWFFIWTNLNPLHAPKDALWQVWLKLARWFWRRRFLNFVNVFLLLCTCNYLPLEKAEPFICTNLNPLHPRMHFAKFGWNWACGSWPSGFGEEDENVKSLRQQGRHQRRWGQRQRRRTTDKLWSEKLTWAFGSGELKQITITNTTDLTEQMDSKSLNNFREILEFGYMNKWISRI